MCARLARENCDDGHHHTIEIEGSPAKPRVFLVIGAVMALFSFMLAYPLSDMGADRILKPIFYGLAVIFGICAALALRVWFVAQASRNDVTARASR
jgi:hypothetical protein